MPESFRAFCRMVSLTAAKTKRILVVSVAWVRLTFGKQRDQKRDAGSVLRVEVEICTVDLIESPEQVLGRSVHIIATRVIGEIVAERRSRKLELEEIDLVQEQDDAGPHEPPGIDHRVKQDQTFHHSILQGQISRCLGGLGDGARNTWLDSSNNT